MMKAKFLLLGIVCALQCVSTMSAMQDSEMAPVAQDGGDTAIQLCYPIAQEQAPATIDGIEQWRQMAATFALINHARCGASAVFRGLPVYDVQHICDDLKQLMKKNCPHTGCDFVTFSEDAFERHGTTGHLRPLECPICGRGFRTRFTQTIHMKMHTPPFRCDVPGCDYACYRRNELSRHMRTHGLDQ